MNRSMEANYTPEAKVADLKNALRGISIVSCITSPGFHENRKDPSVAADSKELRK